MSETPQTTDKPAGNDPGKAVAIKQPLTSGARVAAIVPVSLEETFRLANAIAAAGFAPKAYGNDVNKIMVGIVHGLEVGLTPMAALQSIAVINGTPTIWGDGALALVRASGLLEDFEETFDGTGDGRMAVCMMKRRGEPKPVTRSFSVGDAKKAGLWAKQGPWTQYPQRMMQMRARAWTLRDGFADVLKGLGVHEEMRDMGTLVDAGDGHYTPPRPARADFDPEKAGHADPDQQYRDTMREPPPHDPQTGEIDAPSQPPASVPPAAEAPAAPQAPVASDEGGGQGDAAQDRAGNGLFARADAKMSACATKSEARTTWFADPDILAYRKASPTASDLYDRHWARLTGTK